ncbi:MAG: hypothetical protein V4671_09600, partial [Armatimonadota bacterium]
MGDDMSYVEDFHHSGDQPTSRDTARQLLERFFDADEPISITTLFAECPPDQRDHLKTTLIALN